MASFVKIQSAYVCFSLFFSGSEARQYRAEKVLTQGEGKCQINNEDGPREAAEEAIEIRQGVLIVQPTEARAVYLQCCRFKSGSYSCLSSCVFPFALVFSFHCILSNESKKADNILIFNNKDGS